MHDATRRAEGPTQGTHTGDPHRGPTQGTHTEGTHTGDPHRGPKQGTRTEGRAPRRTHHRRGGPHRGPTQDTHRHYARHTRINIISSLYMIMISLLLRNISPLTPPPQQPARSGSHRHGDTTTIKRGVGYLYILVTITASSFALQSWQMVMGMMRATATHAIRITIISSLYVYIEL